MELIFMAIKCRPDEQIVCWVKAKKKMGGDAIGACVSSGFSRISFY